ncbi:MAG: hypothetical protein HQL87_18415 [Magnetococcales bacterium]|nr:hypothetical protein [Magnetococcales bacterium]
MKASELKKRLQKGRPMSAITIRMPEDVIETMKHLAPRLGFSGYQPLIRHYVGQGLRVDQERLENANMHEFAQSLQRHGVDAAIIDQAMAEIGHTR